MTLGTISICLTVVVLNVHHHEPKYPVPQWIRTIILNYAARILCLKIELSRINREKVFVQKLLSRQHQNAMTSLGSHRGLRGRGENNGCIDEMELIALTMNHHSLQSNGPHVLHDSKHPNLEPCLGSPSSRHSRPPSSRHGNAQTVKHGGIGEHGNY